MSKHRFAFVGCVVLALVCQPVLAQKAEIDAKKLIGTWTMVKIEGDKGLPAGATVKVEFAKVKVEF